MLLPLSALAARFRQWWVDFVLIVAAAAWWAIDPSAEAVILKTAAGYSILIGASTAARAAVRWLTEDPTDRPAGSVIRRLLIAAAGLALVGGAVLALPRCWQGAHPLSVDNTYAGQTRYELGVHGLNSLVTATAALTGTGLTVHDIGSDFTRVGQVVILLLMQTGGLAVLVIGAVAGWRLRQMIHWQGKDDDVSPTGLRRLIAFVVLAALVIEAAGATVLFLSAAVGPEIVLDPWQNRFFAAVFHAVSAFCNAGLTLSPDSLIHFRGHTGVYAALAPLMVLGSIGGPVLYELFRRILHRSGLGLASLSKDSRVTLLATAALILVGAGLLFAIESTPDWQLRYPRDDTPGRLELSASPTSEGAIVFSSEGSPRVRSERMRTIPPPQRLAASVFHSIAARSGGMYTIRLDEPSLSPASRVVLMAWMLIGGAVGGTAGGLRITVVVLLIAAVAFSRRPQAPTRTTVRPQAFIIAAAVAGSMLLLVGLTTFALVYRQAGSLEACLFEAVSACCNVGFSTGLTRQLAFEDRLAGPLALRLASRTAILLAMLLGRVLPLGILLRGTRNVPSAPATELQAG